MAITQTNFKSDLSKVVSKDELRPALTVVKFQNGYAYATDSHCLVKQSLKWMDFTDEEISNVWYVKMLQSQLSTLTEEEEDGEQ